MKSKKKECATEYGNNAFTKGYAMMGKSYCLFLLIGCLCACQTSREGGINFSGKELFLKNTDLLIKDTSLFGKYEIIPFELSKLSAIKWVDKILLFEDKIGVLDLRLCAFFVFNRQGKFLYEINHKGNGPGEYTQLMDVCLDPVDSCLVFLTAPRSISFYSYGGEFKSSIQREDPAHRIVVKGDYIYLVLPDFVNYDKQKYSMLALNRRTGEKTYLLKQGIHPVESSYTSGSILVPGRDALYYMERYTHRIYKVEGAKCTPFYELDLGKFNLPDYLLKEGLDKQYFVEEVFVKTRSVFSLTNFFELSGGFILNSNLMGFFHWDLQKEELNHYNDIINEKYGIDFKYSIHIEPAGENIAFLLSDPILTNMKEHRKTDETPALKALLDNLPDDPNPVLFLYSLKK